LHEYLQAASINYVAVSSGSTGNALLLNPTAPYGNGWLINGGFENGARVAFPDSLNAALLGKFGAVKGGEDDDQALLWIERALREYVLETMNPQVIVDWMGRSDSAQHGCGVGSPEELAALRLIDGQIGLLLQRVRQMNLEDRTDIIVTCDHGFDYEPQADLLAPLRDSGFADDVVIDNEGGSTLLYGRITTRKDRPAGREVPGQWHDECDFRSGKASGRQRLAMLSRRGEGLPAGHFCAGPGRPVPSRAWSGHHCHASMECGAEPLGVAGTQWITGMTGQPAHNGHGGLNPYVTHSTLLAVGPDFARGKVLELPAGNQDIAPTVLSLELAPYSSSTPRGA
jgi:hypothetical protein